MILVQVNKDYYDLSAKEYVICEYIRNKCDYFEGPYTTTIPRLMSLLEMEDEEIEEFMVHLMNLSEKKNLMFEQSKKNRALFSFWFEECFV